MATQLPLLLLFLASLFSVPGTAQSADDRTARSPLNALVQEFIATDDAEAADRSLRTILQDPSATVSAVESIIHAGPSYAPQPIGIHPTIPLTVRGATYHYALYVPVSYDPEKSYALMICLHGAGFTGEAYLERWQARLGEEYILACPTYPQGAWFTRLAEEVVLATMRSLQRRYHIDTDRVFLTGMSNGGIGAWLIGMHHATEFAGLAPMASGIDDVLLPFLKNLRATPVYMIHGAKDQVMPVELSRSLGQELTRLGYPFVYREHDREHPVAGGHYFPREELPDLITWLNRRRRDPLPKQLTVVRDATHLTAFGWVRIDATDHIAAFSENLVDKRDDQIRQRRYATLDAEITAPNRIEVRTERVRQYTLFLNLELVDPSQPVTVVTNGHVSFEGTMSPNVETLLRQSRARQDPRLVFPIQLAIPVEHMR